MRTNISIGLWLVLLTLCSCSDTQKKNETQILTELSELPNTSIISIKKSDDTLKIQLIDSINFTQSQTEGIINRYIAYVCFDVDSTIGFIELNKYYPNRPQLPQWDQTLDKNWLELNHSLFNNDKFTQMIKHLVLLKDGRTGPSIILALNTYYAVIKNGSLDKAWSENSMELLLPICEQCSKGNYSAFYEIKELLLSYSKDAKDVNKSLQLLLDEFEDICKNNKSYKQ
jgi:hypothetical protein